MLHRGLPPNGWLAARRPLGLAPGARLPIERAGGRYLIGAFRRGPPLKFENALNLAICVYLRHQRFNSFRMFFRKPVS